MSDKTFHQQLDEALVRVKELEAKVNTPAAIMNRRERQLEEQLAALKQELADLVAATGAEQRAHASTRAELNAVKAVLANPGLKLGEHTAAASRAEIEAAYNAIDGSTHEGAAARQAFAAAHGRELGPEVRT